MRVKAVRKGFSDRVREIGQVFEFNGKECPSWCVEVDKVKNLSSKDMKATDAISLLNTMRTENEVLDFVKGEERKSVQEAGTARIQELVAAS